MHFSSLSIYFTGIAIVLKDYDADFLNNCWFLFIIIIGLLICKYAPFWQVFSVKSLILRWPLRHVGLLFSQICEWNTYCKHCMLPWIKEYAFYTVKLHKNISQTDFKPGGVCPVLDPLLTSEKVRYITIVFKMLHNLGLFTDIWATHTPCMDT